MALRMIADVCYLPKSKPQKPTVGEDAHFISDVAQVIGVADGVGGWLDKGVDSGDYARLLMKNAQDFVKESRATAASELKNILKEAFHNTAAQGTSTACIVGLDGTLLRAVNLGDSGFMVVRQGKEFYRSRVQQRRFNVPYQLGQCYGADSPEAAEEMVVPVEGGDVVVVGTDGLFDNLYSSEIEECLTAEEGASPATMARKLAAKARAKCGENYVSTPFQDEARKAIGISYGKAKNDDITVVVACIESQVVDCDQVGT